MDLRRVVDERLGGSSKCYGHCEKQSTLRFLPQKIIVAAYACPSGYVSRIVTYGEELHLTWLKEFVSEAVKGMGEVTYQDIRVASRYPWDLGLEGDYDDVVLREAYWTQNYRRTKSEDPNRIALFLCLKCSSLYLQPLTGKDTFCSSCRE